MQTTRVWKSRSLSPRCWLLVVGVQQERLMILVEFASKLLVKSVHHTQRVPQVYPSIYPLDAGFLLLLVCMNVWLLNSLELLVKSVHKCNEFFGCTQALISLRIQTCCQNFEILGNLTGQDVVSVNLGKRCAVRLYPWEAGLSR
jgi:hypothetical protein